MMEERRSLGPLGFAPAQGLATLIVSGCKEGYSLHPPLYRVSMELSHAQGTHLPSALSQVRSYMRQVLEGICYLHQHSVLHLDIKVSGGLSGPLPPHSHREGFLLCCRGLGPADGGHPFPGGSPCLLPSSSLPRTVL